MTLAFAGVGSQFKLGDGASPEVFTKAAEITKISGPEVSAAEIDVTSLDSTGGYKEYITGLKDGGSVSLDANWIKTDAQQLAMRTRVSDGSTHNYRVAWSDGSTATFAAVVTKFSINADATSQLKAAFALRISGPITWA